MFFNLEPSVVTPDIERLLLDTAQAMPQYSRFLPCTMTWLYRYEPLVARHRLARMAAEIPNRQWSARLGLLLDFARHHTGSDHLSIVIEQCKRAEVARPLFDAERSSPGMIELAKDLACPRSKRWRVWTQEPDLKTDVIRPARWVMANNPDLRYRAIFSGNLRASILACLGSDPQCGQSESALARACGATRPALREALDHLELCGMVTRKSTGWRTVIEVSPNALVA